jgi:hypothetical protein
MKMARMRRSGLVSAASVCLCAVGLVARGELVLQDDFSGKTPSTNRFDDTGLMGAWPTTGGAGTTGIIDDSGAGGIGSTSALFVDAGNFQGVAGVFDIVGPPYDEVDMQLPGDAVELRFLFRVPSLADGTNDLRFGILNNGGTQHTADNQGTTASDTIGFGGRVSVTPAAGTGSAVFLYDENTTGGGNMLGGAGLGQFGAASQPFIADTNAHEAVFRMTRTATGYSFKMEIDGGATLSATTNNFLPVTAFHQFGIISASAANDVVLDSVEIDRNTLRNGTFERGQPMTTDGMAADFARHWTTNNGLTVSRHVGLVDGSHTAAYLDGTVNKGRLEQSVETPGSNWRFDVDFAGEDGGASATRSFNLVLANSVGNGQINLRLNGDGGLDVFDTAWRSITPTNFVAFSLDGNNDRSFVGGAGDTNLVYHLTIVAEDYGLPTANYDVMLYALDDPGNMWTTNGLTIWQNMSASTNIVTGLGQVRFESSFSAADFAVDNVSLLIIPEPGTVALLLFGGGCLAVAARRRRG